MGLKHGNSVRPTNPFRGGRSSNDALTAPDGSGSPSYACCFRVILTASWARSENRAVPEGDKARWIGRAAVVAVAAAVVLWIRLLPLSLGSLPPDARDDFRFRGNDGRE